MKTKKCSKCGEERDIKNFGKYKKSKDGLQPWCKGCKKQYYENNKDKYKENHKQYYENNKDKIKEYKKEYKEKNKDKIKQHRNSYMLYSSNTKIRQYIELYEEIKQSDDGHLMCKCTYCGEWYKPTILSLQSRLSAINGTGSGGECRLYCSNNCKNDCPSYRQHLYFRDQKPATSREVQPELRQMVFERDNWTCQKCNTYKDDLQVGLHCHHIEGIQWEPIESADLDICITYCKNCHKEIHRIEGCTYLDMQCA